MKKIIKIGLLLLMTIQLIALDFNNATNIKIRNGVVYENFKQNPFTGVGKIKIDTKKECLIIIATFQNGKPYGDMEQWSCDGNLVSKGKRIEQKNIGHFESWDIKSGDKNRDLYYDEQGKIQRGWIKRNFTDEYDLYPNALDSCYSENIKYKHGKKSGYKMYTKHNCMNKGQVAYFKNDIFIGCKVCE